MARLDIRRCLLGSVSVLIAGVASQAALRAETVPPPSTAEAAAVEQYTPRCGFGQKLFDGETRLRQWLAAEMEGIPGERIATVVPAVRQDCKLTGETRPPVQAVRSSPAAPLYELDFGTLEPGCYVVRIIALVKTEEIEPHRKPVFLDFRVNDQPAAPEGATSYYRQRIPYWDDFHCVTEFYFNADERRSYKGTLAVGQGSLVDLQVHSIEFHDVLKGLDGNAQKTRPGLFTPDERAMLRKHAQAAEVRASVLAQVRALDPYLADPASPELSPDERRQRDELLWDAFPPINSQFLGWFPTAFPQKDVCAPPSLNMDEIAEKHGLWESESASKEWFRPLTLVNRKLGLRYTREDLEANRPLPDPYPFKDDGGAVYLPRRPGMAHADNFSILGLPLRYRWVSMANPLAATDGDDLVHRLPYLYHALGDRRAARDAALLLCKWAHLYPTFTQAQVLDGSLIAPAGIYERDLRLASRLVNEGLDGLQQGFAVSYDFLFDFIKDNQELAGAVGRFIPWVKTDLDVRRLIETRILQFGARQIMRFYVYSDKETPLFLMRTAAVQQDRDITRPWMESLWKETWVYPHERAGLPDYLSTTTQRDGSTDIGSVFYTGQGTTFLEVALMTHRYVLNGGDPRFDLTHGGKYRKVFDACTFPLDAAVAGGFPLSVGDVGGPAKPRLFRGQFPTLEDNFRSGYALTRDAHLAWLTAHYFGRGGESKKEWARLTADAERQGRNPLLSQASRVLANWSGILESGQESDDFRFKRSVSLRVGTGHGHAHADTLDLQLVAHGLRMLNDVGWRGSYAHPNPEMSMVHNLVEVDESNWRGHAWIAAFAPADGALYMRGVSPPPANHSSAGSRTRDVALIDVDDGTPGTQVPAPLPYTDATRFDPKAVMPQSYVFDVERVSGGKIHTYCFHGTVSDEFSVNLANRTTQLGSNEVHYLRRFLQGDTLKYGGDTPPVLQATWRLRRAEDVIEAHDRDGKPVRLAQTNIERFMLNGSYDETAERKYTRVHLLGRDGDRAMVGHIMPNVVNEQTTWPFLYVQRRGENLESVYPAIIEPYAGEPFIASTTLLDIPGNETDAQRAVAVEVVTTNGHRDLCFSDGRQTPRRVGPFEITGRFAYTSSDDKGLRLAHLVEGSRLATPWGVLTVEPASRSARVTRVDYWKRQVWLDGDWSDATLAGQQVELGNDRHKTSFTVIAADLSAGCTVITVDKAIDLSYAHVVQCLPEKRQVIVNIGPVGLENGMLDGLTCTTEDLSKRWSCRILNAQSGAYAYELQGEVSEQDFQPGSLFRLWEFGVGDTARLASSAVVRRTPEGRFTIESNAKATWSENPPATE